MIFGARVEFWLLLGLAVAALAVDQFRRHQRRQRIWLYAFLEQQRREDEHPVSYREDQRVRAIQQRLSRHFGKRALGPQMKRRIEAALGLDQPT